MSKFIKLQKTIKNWASSHKRDILAACMLAAYVVIFVLAYCHGETLYGSTTDWRTQHVVFPDYFRNLFYENHDLFPEFSLNIGGGQNIYSFSYYGLYNPFILLAYLFPFISIRTYLIIVSVLEVIASVWLIYIWCRKRGYDIGLSFILAFVYVNAIPVLFHSHRHIMFVNYMPFLILAMLSVDRFLKTKKWGRLVLCIAAVILCSFYFSVSAFVALGVYMLYAYFQKTGTFLTKDFLKYMGKIIGIFALGIGMTCILLLPTAYVLLAGRGSSDEALFPKELFIPKLYMDNLLYGSYSLGMTALFIYALIHSFFGRKKENIALGIMFVIMTLFSFVPYVLNGTLYINAKAYIPFIPLAILLIGDFLKDLFDGKIGWKRFAVIAILALGIGVLWAKNDGTEGEAVFGISKRMWYFLDAGLVLAAIVLYKLSKKKIIFLIPVMATLLVICAAVNIGDEAVPNTYYERKALRKQEKLIDTVLKEDTDMYRIANDVARMGQVNEILDMEYYMSHVYASLYNKNYQNFLNDELCIELSFRNNMLIAQSNGILSHLYMGERYKVLHSDNVKACIGYELVEDKNGVAMLKNEDVLPMAYGSDKLLSMSTYRTLSFPQKQEALLRYTVVEDDALPEGREAEFESCIEKYTPEFSDIKYTNVEVTETENGHGIKAENEGGIITLALKEPIKDKVLCIRFDADNSKNANGTPNLKWRDTGDLSITINGIRNRLSAPRWKYYNDNTSFEYFISSAEEITELTVEIAPGYGEVGEPEYYLMDYKALADRTDSVDAMDIDRKATRKSTVIKGKLNAQKDEICQLSIPYDAGFTVLVDGKETDYIKVDTAFIGFPVTAGEHDITITFHAPFAAAGKGISLVCILLFAALMALPPRTKRVSG